MPERTDVVGADHEFHSPEYVEKLEQLYDPTAERFKLFDTIANALKDAGITTGTVVELGTGPGFMAVHLLKEMPDIRYVGIDFSAPMLTCAKERLSGYENRTQLFQADLTKSNWVSQLDRKVEAIISTWTLHDLGSEENIRLAFENCCSLLKRRGLILNGDFVKPRETDLAFEPGRITVDQHLSMLESIGFTEGKSLGFFEPELVKPTSWHNYACIQALAP